MCVFFTGEGGGRAAPPHHHPAMHARTHGCLHPHPAFTHPPTRSQAVLQSCDPLPSLADSVACGGRLNVAAAVSTLLGGLPAAAPPPPVPPGPPSAAEGMYFYSYAYPAQVEWNWPPPDWTDVGNWQVGGRRAQGGEAGEGWGGLCFVIGGGGGGDVPSPLAAASSQPPPPGFLAGRPTHPCTRSPAPPTGLHGGLLLAQLVLRLLFCRHCPLPQRLLPGSGRRQVRGSGVGCSERRGGVGGSAQSEGRGGGARERTRAARPLNVRCGAGAGCGTRAAQATGSLWTDTPAG